MWTKIFFKTLCCRLRIVCEKILARSWAVTGHATCSCKQQFPPAFNRHRRISCKAPAFTSRLRLCGEGAEHHFKIHTFYSWGVTATPCLWSFLPPPETKVWIGAISKYDSACACSSCCLSFELNERGQLFKIISTLGPTFCIICAP